MTDEERFDDIERRLAAAIEENYSLLREQLASRDARIVELEQDNRWALSELSRLRTIIQSVGAIASQAAPPPPAPVERGT